MVALLVIFMIVVFITADVIVRMVVQKMQEARLRKQRREALDAGLRLDYADEAKSLKRVEVENPKAKILAVDDEAVVLDSFRKILVMAGYSIDTVERGKEAVGLVRKRDYDFVFVDLKMPEMDGVEVTRAIKHLRPDIDVIIITGYATIESAVETMKYGALDYVEKPFTEDELVDSVNKWLIRRQARLEREVRPKVRLVTPSTVGSDSERVFNVPAGVFISTDHTWASIEMNGSVRVGVDDFVQKLIGSIDDVELPQRAQQVKKEDPLFSIFQASRKATCRSPVSGKVSLVNTQLLDNPELINMNPYELGWICCVEPTDLSSDLRSLKIGAEAISWYQEEIDRFVKMRQKIGLPERGGNGERGRAQLDRALWEEFSKAFLHV